MSIVIDLIVVAAIAIIALISAKQGFVTVCVQAVGYILAAMLAFAISVPLASVTYDKVIEKPIVDSMVGVCEDFIEENQSMLNEGLDENSQTVADDSSNQKIVDEIINSLPDILPKKEIETASDSISGFAENITTYMSEGAESMAYATSKEIVKPLACKVVSVIYSAIILSSLSVLINIIAKFLGSKIVLGRLEKYNRIFGGVFGAVKGAVLVGIVCAVVSAIINFTGISILFISPKNLDKTFIFEFLADLMLKFYY